MSVASWESRGGARRPWGGGPARAPGSLPPWVAFPLILPFGLSGGYAFTALIFFLSQGGVSATGIGGFVALAAAPQTFKFLYAPLIDTTLGPRRWHLIGTVATAATLLALAVLPATRSMLGPLTALGFLCTFAGTLVLLPADVVMAYDVAPGRKGRAAGWASAANLGGGALGGGLALWLTARGAPVWLPATALAGLCLLCAPFMLLTATRPPLAPGGGWLSEQRALVGDVWRMIRSRLGVLTLLLAVLPIGTGAMQNLLPVLARDWGAGAGEVALVVGGAAGVLQILGALLGGVICDRFNRRWTYCASGAGLALVSIAMALGPRTPAAFVGFSFAYLFLVGVSFSAFTAAVLEAIGKGAAASKYTLIICASNAAIFAEGALEGWVHDRFSLTTMLFLEGGGALVSIPLFFLAATLTKRPWRRAGGLAAAP